MKISVVSFVCLLPFSTVAFSDAMGDQLNTELPDIELLEFLGAWQTTDGDFLDPLLLAGDAERNVMTETAPEGEKDE